MTVITDLPVYDAREAVEDLLEFAKRDHVRFGTGWSLDDTCGTVGAGEMALVWARSGCGKSTLFLNIIRNTPEVPTLVVNMEMTPRRQIEWLTSMTFNLAVPSRNIEDVLRWGEDEPRYEETADALYEMGRRYPALWFSMPSRPSVSDIGFLVEDLPVRPSRVFIDHLTLMKGGADYSAVTTNASALHSWALHEGLAVHVLQQAGRYSGEGKNFGHLPVTLNDGVFGGEADADWIFGAYRPDRDPKYMRPRELYDDPSKYTMVQQEYYRVKNQVRLQCIKNRPFGDTLEAGIELYYSPHTRRLEELGGYTR